MFCDGQPFTNPMKVAFDQKDITTQGLRMRLLRNVKTKSRRMVESHLQLRGILLIHEYRFPHYIKSAKILSLLEYIPEHEYI